MTPRRSRRPRPVPPLRGFAALALAAIALVAGCSSPNKANIELRKQLQDQRAELERLRREKLADAATIRALQSGGDGGVARSLDPSAVQGLFTVAGLKLGRLTGPADLDRSTSGDDGLKVYAVPTDASGDSLKAAGSFVVEAFDLAAESLRLGRWEFPAADAPDLWVSGGLVNGYVLPCPLDATPAGEVTVRVAFTDALTGRTVDAQKVVMFKPAGG